MKFVYKNVRHNGVLSDKDMSVIIDGKNIPIEEIERIETTPTELFDLIEMLTKPTDTVDVAKSEKKNKNK